MKSFVTVLFFSIFFISCSSVKVLTDFDSSANFSQYKSFAFSKNQIKKIEISDLDKKRILSSIEKQMQMKGYTISNNPDLIINVNTKSREDVYINRYNDYPYYGWYPYGMSTTYRPSSRIIGLLYIFNFIIFWPRTTSIVPLASTYTTNLLANFIYDVRCINFRIFR